MSKRMIGYIIVAILLFSAVAWVLVKIKEHSQKNVHLPPPTAVDVAVATQQEWYDQIKATGSMSAFQGIMVQAEVAGRVTQINFEDGTFIEKGQPIMQIYPDIIEAQLQGNKASLRLAQLDYERGVELYKSRVISRQQLDTLTANLRQDEAAVAQTQAQLVQYNITAPFSGMLGLRLVDIGTQVAVNQNLVQLQQIDPIRAQFTVPEVYLSKLLLGQTVSISPSNTPNKTYSGVVYAFDSGVDPKNRSLGVRARVPNQQHELIPGTFVEVILFAGKKHSVITVPQPAIAYSAEEIYVYKIKDNKAIKTTVTLGPRKGNEVAVTSGLKVGDVVVTAGQEKLTDNASIKIRNASNQQIANNKNNLTIPNKATTRNSTSRNKNQSK